MQDRACAVLRTPAKESAAKAMQAAIDGGFNIVEFTLTTPGCLDLVADFRKKYDGKIMVGCGTIMDIEDAQNALDAGSEFIVMPVLVPEVRLVLSCPKPMYCAVSFAVRAHATLPLSPCACLFVQVVTWCRERNIVSIPGCTSPTELYTAYRVRLFVPLCLEILRSEPPLQYFHTVSW
jgi:2-keto-3-deoxy-6-phosphogluconate aldolase